MYDMITNLVLVNEVYDGNTGKFLGYATFQLPASEEKKF